MLDYLVITADAPQFGRGVRGYTLHWFLRTYFGGRRARRITPEQLRRADRIEAGTVFLGLPTSLTPDDMKALTARRIVLFDYLDQNDLAWTSGTESWLRSISNIYLKPWFDSAWNHEIRMGMLPIRRTAKLSTALRMDRATRRLRGKNRPRQHDVAFLGRANRTVLVESNKTHVIDQRTQWLTEIGRDAPELSFWGGFMEPDRARRRRLESNSEDAANLMYLGRKLNFFRYFHALQNSKVLLAPGGNVPWTYRHYESIYAGGVVVTIDFRDRDLLVPLPEQGIVHVEPNEPVLPAIRQALEMWKTNPDIGRENIAHLENYLLNGVYSRRKRPLIDRFLAQLEG